MTWASEATTARREKSNDLLPRPLQRKNWFGTAGMPYAHRKHGSVRKETL